jgi:DNA-binding MarR family transcriptional regulator
MQPRPSPSAPDTLLMWQFLRTFIWYDRALQEAIAARGWTQLSRGESQVMLLAAAGITRPTEVSRQLGLSRQAINQTLALLVAKKLVTLAPDPADKRCKIIAFAPEGAAMRKEARTVLTALDAILAERLGEEVCRQLRAAPESTWEPATLASRRHVRLRPT